MEKYQELSYLNQLGLRNLQKNQAGYACSCPICGDSTKHKYKRRCYILTNKHEHITVFCHKCGLSTNFKKFIQMVSPAIYEDYVAEEKRYLLTKGNLFSKSESSIVIKQKEETNLFNLKLFKLNTKYFTPAIENNECLSYCNKRKIPISVVQTLYYCNNPKLPSYKHLVFPLYKGDMVYGFSSRSMVDKKFHIHLKNDDIKVYNFFNVNLEKPVYIFESIIDSLYIPNSIACLGSDLSNKILSLIQQPIMCFDNDKVGLTKSLKYVEKGYKVFIFPSGIKGKDINELIVKWEFKPENIYKMIKNNIFWNNAALVRLKIAMRYKR